MAGDVATPRERARRWRAHCFGDGSRLLGAAPAVPVDELESKVAAEITHAVHACAQIVYDYADAVVEQEPGCQDATELAGALRIIADDIRYIADAPSDRAGTAEQNTPGKDQ